jgi:hypothetical protein
MKDALILWGGVFMIGLPFIIWGTIILWREHKSKKFAGE